LLLDDSVVEGLDITEGVTVDGDVDSVVFPVNSVNKRHTSVGFEVFTAVTMKNGVFWDVTPSGSCKN
jgi:hypothetical protein